jgi:DNA-binding GntR family transcriptional regulator
VSSPLYELIYSVLREHIAGGRFPPGLVLGESTVARAFNVSRIPAGAALKRLHREGLVSDFDGRGYLAGPQKHAEPIRLELAEAGFVLDPSIAAELSVRNRRGRIYPDVEHTVAACLSYGRFLLNESALAEHYRVSRTVAHEVLTRLERTGLVTQDVNQRWYAGPLTPVLLSEHYELRWLLEPAALGQVIDELDPVDLGAKLERVQKARGSRPPPRKLEQLEHDLHVDIVLRCHNLKLRETIRRSQLPIIATHSAFEHSQSAAELQTMVSEHEAILESLVRGQSKRAMQQLENHLRRSLEPNIELLLRLGSVPEEHRPPYLIPAAT